MGQDLFFYVLGRLIPQTLMDSPPVVERLDGLEQRRSSLLAAGVTPLGDELVLDGAEKALGDRVVVAVARRP